MIGAMPRKRPPFVLKEITRHKTVAYYFRQGKGPRTRLPDLGAPDFQEAYLAALRASGPAKKRIVGAGSLEWLVSRYRDSGAYRGLSPATRKQRDNIFKGVLAKAGHHPYSSITKKIIANGREDRASTPAQARNFLDAMRGLFRWALEADLVQVDPTHGVSNPRRPKTGGFAVWNDADVEAYEAKWPEGTRERVWFHVLLYTGLRRGDAVLIGRQHVRDGVATIRTEKTGTEVSITILPPLMKTLAAGPTSDLAFICGTSGKPLTKESFGNMFRAACLAAGVKKSAHGVRKIGATRAAEAGATVAELEAMFGWTGGAMASLYTKSADRKRLAKSGGEKIGNAINPHPNSVAPHLKKGAL